MCCPFVVVFGVAVVVVIVAAVVVEASAPKVYPRVTLASGNTLSESVVRTSRGGEGVLNMFCLIVSSLELIAGDSFLPWYPQGARRAQSSV